MRRALLARAESAPARLKKDCDAVDESFDPSHGIRIQFVPPRELHGQPLAGWILEMSTLPVPRSVAVGGVAAFGDDESGSVPWPEFAVLFDSAGRDRPSRERDSRAGVAPANDQQTATTTTTTTAPALRRFVSTSPKPSLYTSAPSSPATATAAMRPRQAQSPTWSFTVTGLAGGETRAFRCIAVNSIGKSLPGPIACYTTAPSTPAKCSKPRKSKSGASVSWDAPSHDGGVPVHWYKAEELRKHRDGTMTTRAFYNGPKRWCEIATGDSVPRGTTIRYRVQAFNRLGAGPFSDALVVEAGICAPDTPPTLVEACENKSDDVSRAKVVLCEEFLGAREIAYSLA